MNGNMMTMPVLPEKSMRRMLNTFYYVKHMKTVHSKKNGNILEDDSDQVLIAKIAQNCLIWLQCSSFLYRDVGDFSNLIFGINDDDDDMVRCREPCVFKSYATSTY